MKRTIGSGKADRYLIRWNTQSLGFLDTYYFTFDMLIMSELDKEDRVHLVNCHNELHREQ